MSDAAANLTIVVRDDDTGLEATAKVELFVVDGRTLNRLMGTVVGLLKEVGVGGQDVGS